MKIKRLELFKDYLRTLKNLQQETFALQQLQKLFNESFFIPFTSYSISPSAILYILNDIIINERKQIIEFGSGISTVYIAKLIDVLDLNVEFYSIESNKDWAEKQTSILKKYDLDSKVKIIIAPIINVDNKEITFEKQKLWYDTTIILKEIKTLTNIDLVIVDGPFGGTTPYARYSALPFLKNRLSNSFSFYLDDLDREEENKILKEWQQQLNCRIFKKNKLGCLHSENSFAIKPYML